MLALKLYQGSLCPGCSGDTAVTTAAENEDRFKPELPLQCFRCLGFARSHEAYKDEPHPHTLVHLVSRRPTR